MRYGALIIFGETINGSLSATDCQLPDLSYADFYLFHGTAGQQVTINLTSSAFDTYLGLANEAGTFVIEDNDGGGGTNPYHREPTGDRLLPYTRQPGCRTALVLTGES